MDSNNSHNSLIPFFVVDRPMSLEILKYCEINSQNTIFGLMGHANTSLNFQTKFREFPHENIKKMVDSGVFTKEGCRLNYKDLFKIYERMGADYGIIIDVLKDKERTLKSAKLALETYYDENSERNFELVGVAQGTCVEEYFDCFKSLKDMGYKNIAIGGLLEKRLNTARYVQVKDEKFLNNVLEKIRKYYSDEWIFTLGCYHPKRHQILQKYGVYGADYKGWIFNYKTPKKIIKQKNKELEENEKNLLIENSELSDLLKKRYQIQKKFNSKIDHNEKKLLEKKFDLLEKKIFDLRQDIAEDLKDEEYSFNLKSFGKFLEMNPESKRKHRFNQVRGYLYKNVFSNFKENLLIISCSQRKSTIPNPAPAIDIYDGTYFQILKKTDKKIMDNLHVMIISAKYGIIGIYDPIEKYNKKMTRHIAKELNKPLKKELSIFLDEKNFENIFISLGKDYRLAIDSTNFKKPVKEAEGKMGEKLSQTKKWLNSIN